MRRNIIVIALTVLLFLILTGSYGELSRGMEGPQVLFGGLALTIGFAGMLMLVVGGAAILSGNGTTAGLLPGAVAVLAATTVSGSSGWGSPVSLAVLLAAVVTSQLISPFDNEPQATPQKKSQTTRKRAKKKA